MQANKLNSTDRAVTELRQRSSTQYNAQNTESALCSCWVLGGILSVFTDTYQNIIMIISIFNNIYNLII